MNRSIDSLLELERCAPGMPEDASDRLAERLGIVPPGGGSPSGGGGTGGGGNAVGNTSGAANAAGTGAVGSFGAAHLGIALLLGAAIGSAGTLLLTPDDPMPEPVSVQPVEVREVVREVEAQPTPEAQVEAEAAAPNNETAPPPPATVPPSSQPLPGSSDVERLLIERAEAAFAVGSAGAALAALNSHARRFPRGRLSEERDALRARALYAGGRNAEANQAVERFFARHPNSVFGHQLRRARERAREQTHTAATDSDPAVQTPARP